MNALVELALQPENTDITTQSAAIATVRLNITYPTKELTDSVAYENACVAWSMGSPPISKSPDAHRMASLFSMSPPDDEKTILVVGTITKNPGQIALTGTLLTATSGATLMWQRSLFRPDSYIPALPAHYAFVRYIEPCDVLAAYIAQKLRILAEHFTASKM